GPAGDLHDPITEQSLGLDARDRVLANSIGVAPGDVELDTHLAAGLAGESHVHDAPDLHAGQPYRRAFHQPTHLGEVRMDRVTRLEQPRAGAERVDHAEEGRERDQDEDADAKLQPDLSPVFIHWLASPAAAARTASFIGSPRLRRRRLALPLPCSCAYLSRP